MTTPRLQQSAELIARRLTVLLLLPGHFSHFPLPSLIRTWSDLVALCAPRPVLFSNAAEDQWANPAGQFEVLQAADPVYRFLGAGGLEAKQMPELGRLIDSKLGYFIRPGKHSMTKEDWKVFLDFADQHFGKAKPD